jgi:neutral ceramidase
VRARRWRLRALFAGSAVYVLLLVDWTGLASPAPPRLLRAFRSSSSLEAGAAEVRLAPPLPVVRPSFRWPRVVARRERQPLEVRSVVLRSGGKSLAIVLADLMVVTEDLDRALEARLADLDLDGVLFFPTHTHGSVGGFDSHLVAQVVGLGAYRADVVKAILDSAEEAVRRARGRVAPVHVRTAETRIPGWALNRSRPGAAVDDALTVVTLDGDAGQRVATLAVVAAHPTLFPQTVPELSPDYPGVAMGLLEKGGGVALVLQGAGGDSTPPGSGWPAIDSAGTVVAQHVAAASREAASVEDVLGFSEVEVGLPDVDARPIRPFLLRRPLCNLLFWMLPRAARVTVLELGDVMFLTLPGEPTELARRRILAGTSDLVAKSRRVRLLGLAQGYVSYIDTPDRVREGSGEAKRAWYGPALMDDLTRGLRAAVTDNRPR